MSDETKRYAWTLTCIACYVLGWYGHWGLYGSAPKETPAPLIEPVAGIGAKKIQPDLARHSGPICIWPDSTVGTGTAVATRLSKTATTSTSTLPPMLNLRRTAEGELVEVK